MSKYLITLEVTTDTNPEQWDFDYFVNVSDGEDYIVTSIQEIEGEEDVEDIAWSSSNPTGDRL
jgi:PhoPQ-activated pathogenicity-related protein